MHVILYFTSLASIFDGNDVARERNAVGGIYVHGYKFADKIVRIGKICHSAEFVSAEIRLFLFVVIFAENFHRFADVFFRFFARFGIDEFHKAHNAILRNLFGNLIFHFRGFRAAAPGIYERERRSEIRFFYKRFRLKIVFFRFARKADNDIGGNFRFGNQRF